MQPYSLKAFQRYQEHDIKRHDLGDLSMKKQNKMK
jgi:hypothetical protein